jgi:hypothetical protein
VGCSTAKDRDEPDAAMMTLRLTIAVIAFKDVGMIRASP